MQGCSPLLSQYHNGLLHKKKTNGGGGRLRTNFFENPLGFLGFCFNPRNSEQNKASPKEISHNCVTTLILRAKTKNPQYSTRFFLNHPWNFYIAFNQPPRISLATSSITLEIPYPQPRLCLFSFLAQSITYRCMNLPKTDDNDGVHSASQTYRSNSSHLFLNHKNPCA